MTYNIVSHDRAKFYLNMLTSATLSHYLVPMAGPSSNGICLYRVTQTLAISSLAKTGKANNSRNNNVRFSKSPFPG